MGPQIVGTDLRGISFGARQPGAALRAECGVKEKRQSNKCRGISKRRLDENQGGEDLSSRYHERSCGVGGLQAPIPMVKRLLVTQRESGSTTEATKKKEGASFG